MAVTDLHPFNPFSATPLDWAQMYRRAGLNVVPAFYPGEEGSKGSWKRPHMTSWQEYTQIWVPDKQVENWWGPGGLHVERCQMGVVTGSGSGGLLVVDLDLHKDPQAETWYRTAMERYPGPQFPTPTQKTGGGGYQVLFRATSGWTPPTNKTAIGVDIRGEGGFAMMPPSRHESGNQYHWLQGATPWDTPIMTAPPELVAAIDELVANPSRGSSGTFGKVRERSASPASAVTTFGELADGREDRMMRVCFAAVVDLYRERNGMLPPSGELEERAWRAYLAYETRTASRLPGAPDKLTERLDREGRGPTEFRAKFLRLVRQWDTKVAAAAREAPPPSSPFGEEATYHREVEPGSTSEGGTDTSGLIPCEPAFPIDGPSIPPREWIVPGVVLRKHLSVLVAPPGSGKSLFTLQLACAVAVGMAWAGWIIRQSVRVLIINAEDDHDEMRRRLWAAAREMGIDQAALADRVFLATSPESIVIAKIDGRTKAVIRTPLIEQLIATVLAMGIGLIVADPFAETFEGDENSNSEVKWAV